MYVLRPYQELAIQLIRQAIIEGHRRILLVIPTGGGKTVTAAELIDKTVAKGNRVVFLAHRQELIDQCSEKLDAYGVPHGIIQGRGKKRDPKRRDRSLPVQVASIATLVRREHWPARLIVIDEAHRATANTYMKICERYEDENPIILGLSVGPSSFVEMRGGCFGAGFVGKISDAFRMVKKAYGNRRCDFLGYEAYSTAHTGVMSRGWEDGQFCWKHVKTFIRHRCDRGTSRIHVGGDKLTLTNDHSVYVARPDVGPKSSGKKQRAFIGEVAAGQVLPGDVCLGDDGRSWDDAAGREVLFDTLDLKKNLYVKCNFSKIADRLVSEYGNKAYGWSKSGYLPAEVFLRNEDSVGHAEHVATPGGHRVKCLRYIKLSDWSYTLGFYLGDGWVNDTRLNFAIEKKEYKNILRRIESELPDVNFIPRHMPGKSIELRCANSILSSIFSHVTGGAKAHNKYIPGDWIISWPRWARLNLLAGLIDSDGHISCRSRNRARCYYVTTSKALARSLLSLLRSLNIRGSLYTAPPKKGGVVNGRVIQGKKSRYTIHWSAWQMLGVNGKHFGKRGTRYEYGGAEFNEHFVSEIKAQKRSRRPEYVYDLEMCGHPSFVVNGTLVHNTATPYRMNGKPLGDLFTKLIDVVSVQELVDQGSLVNPKVFVASSPDLSNVRVGSNGDFRQHGENSVEDAMSKTVLHGEIVENWVKFCASRLGSHVVYERLLSAADVVQGDLFPSDEAPTQAPPQKVKYTDCDAKTVVFACSVKHSKMIAEQFRSVGVSAVHIDGDSKPAERRRVLRDLKSGKISVVSQVGLLTEGWDLPALECIIIARSTRSRNVYKQIGGRIMRPSDEARFKMVIDHGNCTFMHGRLTDPEIFSLEKSERRVKKKDPVKNIRECHQCKAIIDDGLRVCQECGAEIPSKEVEHTSEILRELQDDEQIGPAGEEIDVAVRQQAFNKIAAQCVEYGYRPAWARVRYELMYGHWPTGKYGIRTPRFFYEYEEQAKLAQEQKKKAEAATRS